MSLKDVIFAEKDVDVVNIPGELCIISNPKPQPLLKRALIRLRLTWAMKQMFETLGSMLKKNTEESML